MSANDPSTRRDDRAKAAAPYLHPRLSSVEHTGDTEEFPKAADLTDDQLAGRCQAHCGEVISLAVSQRTLIH